MIRDYNRIIESLSVKLIKAKNIEIIKPVIVEDVYDVENVLLVANKGDVAFTKTDGEKVVIEKGEILFIPEGKLASIMYGRNAVDTLSNDQFISDRSEYLKYIDKPSPNAHFENCSFISFEAKVFDSVNFLCFIRYTTFCN